MRQDCTYNRQGLAIIEALIVVAEDRGPLMHARIGVMRALNRHVKRVFHPRPERPALGTSEAGAGSMTRGLK
jgi:hypothetical protein